MFLSPWIQTGYGIFEPYQQIRAGIELSDQPLASRLGLATARHFGGQKLWDE